MNNYSTSQLLPPGLSKAELPTVKLKEYAKWQTPGLVVAENIASHELVRLVLEKVEPDRYVVFVVLDGDPEELLDAIFQTEQSLYETFRKMPFDLRVIKASDEWDAEALARQSIPRYRRP